MSCCMAFLVDIDVMDGDFYKYDPVLLWHGQQYGYTNALLDFVVVVDMEEGLRTKEGPEGP